MSPVCLHRRTSLLAAVPFAALLALLPITLAHATDGAWNVDASGNWSDPANWSGGVPSIVGDTVTFGSAITAPRTVTLDTSETVSSLTLTTTSPYGWRYIIAGTNTLTLAGPAASVAVSIPSAVNSGDLISAPIALIAPTTVNTNSTSSLALTFSGPLSGAGSLEKTGAGGLTLSGDNSNWTGPLTLDAGTLKIGGSGNIHALGANPSPVTVANGATLDVTGIGYAPTATPVALSRDLTLSGPGAGNVGTLHFGNYPVGGNGIITGNIAIAAGATIDVWGGTLHLGDPNGVILGGSLTGTGGLTIGGLSGDAAPLQLNIHASHTGGTTVAHGTLIVGPRGSLVGTGNTTVTSAATLRVSAPAGTDPNSASLTPNSVILNGILALVADLDPAPFLSSSSATTATILFAADNSHDINLSTLRGGADGSAVQFGVTYPATAVTYSGTFQANAPATLQIGGTPQVGGNSSTLTISSPLTAANNIAGVTIANNSSLALTNTTNSYSGSTTVVTGTLIVPDASTLGSSSTPILLGQTSISGTAQLWLTSSSPFARNIATDSATSGLAKIQAAPSFSGVATISGDVNFAHRLDLGTSTAGLVMSGTLSGNGTLTTYGNVTLTHANTFTGSVQVYGTLDCSTNAAQTLGAATTIYVGATNNAGLLRLAAPTNYASNASFIVKGSGTISLPGKFLPPVSSSSNGYLAIDTTTYDAISNLATLGNGAMFLGSTTSGTFTGLTLRPGYLNTYRFGVGGGTLTIPNGVLVLNSAGTILQIGDPNYLSNGSLAKGYGTTVLTAANTYTGATVVYVGTLDVSQTTARALGSSKNISITPSAASVPALLRLKAASNYDPAATISITNYGVVSVASDFLPPITNTSSGILALDTVSYTAVSSLATLGGGAMFLGSTTSGSFTGATLAPGNPLTTGGPNAYRLGGGNGALTIPAAALTPNAPLRIGQYNAVSGGGTVIITGDLNAGPISVYNGSLTFAGGNITTTTFDGEPSVPPSIHTLSISGITTLQANASLTASRIRQNSLVIGDASTTAGARVSIAGSSPDLTSGYPTGDDNMVSILRSLTIATVGGQYRGTFDLANNDLLIDYIGSTSPVDSVEAMVRSGYNHGTWTGTGIMSSDAAARNNFTLLVIDNATLGLTTFDGVTMPSTAVIIKFTHQDDLTGDGLVRADDRAIFSANYATYNVDTGSGAAVTHAMGDMDFDGLMTFNDAQLFALFYNESLAHLPEPTSLAVLAFGATAGFLVRRKK